VGVEWQVQDRNLDLDSLTIEYRVEGQETWQPVPGVLPKFEGQSVWMPDQPGRTTVRCQVQDRAQNLGISTIDLDAGPISARPKFPATENPALTLTPPKEGPTLLPEGDREPRSRAATARDRILAGTGHGSTESLPANRQLVHDSNVSLDYQIEDSGPSGISVIELWITRDMGRSWNKVGEDSDHESPFEVDLGTDGLYGLSLVAKNGMGFGDRPPAAGDQPQTWVEVDKTPPQVRVFPPEMGKASDVGSLVIAWKAEDPNLGERCVSLYYTEDGRGEPKPIVTGIENSGRYVWKLDGQVPMKFRVVVEVSDRAGNRKKAESTEVTIDTRRPRASISRISSPGDVRR
jgi:hypothetical protein